VKGDADVPDLALLFKLFYEFKPPSSEVSA